MRGPWVFPGLMAAVLAAIIALLGATITTTGPWYHGLARPPWAPDDAAWPVAWTAIFALNALGAVTGWLATPTSREREWLLGVWALTGFLTIMWSLLFFRFHRPDWALIEVLGLWVSVAALIVITWRRSMTGAVLLIPYLLWVTFAGYLTMTIVNLNGSFG